MAIFGVGCGRLCRAVYTPPAPLQQNAIKDGPGGGRGTNWTGNRTVTHCRALVFGFSPFSKGEMLSVFFIMCFLCLARRLLSFFLRSPLLRVAV